MIRKPSTKTEHYRQRYAQLKQEANTWRPHWKDISDFMLPRKGRYLSSDSEESNQGDKKHQHIINGSGHDALRIVAAGLQGGLTSPSRPWFVLAHPDQKMMELPAVKEWLYAVQVSMLNVFERSNFYGSLHGGYKELAAFGVHANLIEEDFKTVIRCRPFTIGEYMLSLNSQYRPDTLYRRFELTTRQLVQEFGGENVSQMVREAYNSNQMENKYFIVHLIEPNEKRILSRGDQSAMEYKSIYFEESGDADEVLREGGYKTMPFVAPRWDVTGVDTYGGCPGMDALGDVKQLQKMEEKKLKALDKMIDPPVNAPAAMKGKSVNLVPGGVNYYEPSQGNQGVVPSYQVRPDLQNIAFEIDRVEQRIRRFFFNDLFLMIANDQRSGVTATEVARKHEEKMMMLGPILERLQAEMLDPIIERTFSIMTNIGILPPPPKELEGQDIKIEYVSLLAQAQKLVSTASIEQTVGFVGNLAGVNPNVLDKVDFDEAVDQYANAVGVAPKIIRSDAEAAEIRQQREAKIAEQQQMEQSMQMAQGAKLLSETQMGEKSALENMMEGTQNA